ncbi:hypothetical protein DFH28DRAFT_968416 [Melampsora americana]|nr:hypothetical protein DFH28DRAFT_968416 [Melampsora americana]
MGLLGVSEFKFTSTNLSRQPISRKTLKRQTRSQFTPKTRPISSSILLSSTQIRVIGMTGYSPILNSNENEVRRNETNDLDLRLPGYQTHRQMNGFGMVVIQEFNETNLDIDFDQWARFSM